MKDTGNPIDMDGLRLIGLGRVPACAECPRYQDLVAAYTEPALRGSRLSAVPKNCAHAYCAPLARRYGVPPVTTWDLRRVAS